MEHRRRATWIAFAAVIAAGTLAGCTHYLPRDATPEARIALEQDTARCRQDVVAGNGFSGDWVLAGMLAGAVVGALQGAQAGALAGLSADQLGIGVAAGAGVGLVIGFATSTSAYTEAANHCMDQRGYRRAS